MARLSCTIISSLFVALVVAGCQPGPIEPTVVERWKVNPSNIDAFIDNRNSRNQILVGDDSIYVAFAGVISGRRTTDVFLRRLDRNSGEWDPTRRVSSSNGLSRAPAIAVDGDTLHYAWMADRSELDQDVTIEYRRSLDMGRTWSESQQLEIGNIRTRHPRMVRSGDNLYLYLSNGSGGQPEEVILFVSHNQGESWQEHRFGDPQGGRMATRPQLIIGAEETASLVWVDNDGIGTTLVASATTDGGRNWAEPVAINDLTQPVPYAYSVCGAGEKLAAVWAVRDGTSSRVLVDRSLDGGRSWGADEVILDDYVRVITPICENLEDNNALVSWAVGSTRRGEVGMRILYHVVDVTAKAVGSGVAQQRSLVGPPVVGKTFQSFSVVAVGSDYASAYATGEPQELGVYVSVSSDLAEGFAAGVLVSEQVQQIDSLAPRLEKLGDSGLALLYNSREASTAPTERTTMLGDLFLATLGLR